MGFSLSARIVRIEVAITAVASRTIVRDDLHRQRQRFVRVENTTHRRHRREPRIASIDIAIVHRRRPDRIVGIDIVNPIHLRRIRRRDRPNRRRRRQQPNRNIRRVVDRLCIIRHRRVVIDHRHRRDVDIEERKRIENAFGLHRSIEVDRRDRKCKFWPFWCFFQGGMWDSRSFRPRRRSRDRKRRASSYESSSSSESRSRLSHKDKSKEWVCFSVFKIHPQMMNSPTF